MNVCMMFPLAGQFPTQQLVDLRFRIGGEEEVHNHLMAEVVSVTSWNQLEDEMRMNLLPGQQLDIVLANGSRMRVVVKDINWEWGSDDPVSGVQQPR